MDHLGDRSTYTPVLHDPTALVVQGLHELRHAWGPAYPDSLWKYFLDEPPGGWKPAAFYILPKLHKKQLAGRPIAASHSWVTSNVKILLATYDVSSLYPSIPLRRGLDARANASPGECEEALPEPQQRHLLGRRSGGRKEEQKLLRLFPSRFPLRESNKHTRTALPAAPPPPPPLPPPPPPPLIPAPPAPAPPLPMPRGDARTGGSAGKSRPQGDFDAQ
ncbi:unnamed protein product [Closterium sp. NIES-54]